MGHLAFAIPGEFVEASGRWVVDRDHGQQFKADSIRTTYPGNSEGMERYLGSGFVKGIGPHFAAKLVEMFGVKVFEIIDQQPERLVEVHGIGKTRQERIASSWHEQRVVREIMVFLHSYGVGTARAVRSRKTLKALVGVEPLAVAARLREDNGAQPAAARIDSETRKQDN